MQNVADRSCKSRVCGFVLQTIVTSLRISVNRFFLSLPNHHDGPYSLELGQDEFLMSDVDNVVVVEKQFQDLPMEG